MTDIFHLLIFTIAVGGGVYLLQLLPIDGTIKRIFTTVIVIVSIIWALRWFMEYVK